MDQINFWIKEHIENHNTTITKLRSGEINVEEKFEKYLCNCNLCLGEYRSKIRDITFNEQKKIITAGAERLQNLILTVKISQIAEEVFLIRKKVDKNVHNVRYKLKRASLNKLEVQTKDVFKEYFSVRSELGTVYIEKLKAYLNSYLVEHDLSPNLITDKEYDRFFSQLDVKIWKPEKFILREFKKLVSSLVVLKTKDISSTILQDYLGQFWIHSRARRLKRKFIYHMGPTNSGKTYHAVEALSQAKSGCYLAPLRLLATELFDTLNDKGTKTSLLTGEEVIEMSGATHFSSTIEMAKLDQEFDCCVIDEIQMITDSQRGWAWTRALVNLISPEIHLCGDPSVLELVKEILKLTEDELEIKEYQRMTELKVMPNALKLTELEKNDALIVFSRRNALKYKGDLEKLGFKVSIVYGRLSPEVRREQARKFDEGETDIMVSTDAIAMGMNLPVKRIVFSTLTKFIDGKEIIISDSEIKQIAGRAGRFKRFPTGFATCLTKVEEGLDLIKNALNMKLKQEMQGMVGPDLDIYTRVNDALDAHGLSALAFSDFLRLFNTMTFQDPFYCVDLKEMIEVAESVEEADTENVLSPAEIFGFACAPVNLGLTEHVQYFMWILNHYVKSKPIYSEDIDVDSDNIDYLETAIKCVELYQWLSRHFHNKNFDFDADILLANKSVAVEQLNKLLSDRITRTCSSCNVKLDDKFRFNICEKCFAESRGNNRSRRRSSSEGFKSKSDDKKGKSGGRSNKGPSKSGPSKPGHSKKKRGSSGSSIASKLTKYR